MTRGLRFASGPRYNLYAYVMVASFVALLFSTLWWELRGAPLRTGGSWLVVKCLPLLFCLRGVVYLRPTALKWTLLLSCLYLTEGLVRMLDPMPTRLWALIELGTVVFFMASAIAYLRKN